MHRATLVVATILAAGCSAVSGSKVSSTDATAASTSTQGAPALRGTRWHWLLTIDPERTWLADDPTRYTLQLSSEGRAAVRADCNRGSGSYTLEGQSLQLGNLATTRAMCPPGSLDSRYLKQLAAIRNQASVAGLLRADLYADSGTMWFAAEPEAKAVWYACEGGRTAWAVYTRDRARVGTGPDVHELPASPAASGARYAAGDLAWHTKGDEAFLERRGTRVVAGCRAERPAV